MAYVWLNDVVKQAEILFFVKMGKTRDGVF
jgi:hypothetical protein